MVVMLVAAVALGGCQVDSDNAAGKTANAPRKGGVLGIPRPQPVLLAEGTSLTLVLETAVSSKASHEGDLVVAKLAEDVKLGEKVVVPAGSEVRGQVVAAVPSGKVKGRARLAFDFDKIVVKGKEYPFEARTIDITAPDSHKRDAGIIGGGAGLGAIIGAIAGGKKGAAVGAAVGAGTGTGVVLTTTGKEVEVVAGSRLSVKLTKEARLG
jgi:hypothetical protein